MHILDEDSAVTRWIDGAGGSSAGLVKDECQESGLDDLLGRAKVSKVRDLDVSMYVEEERGRSA